VNKLQTFSVQQMGISMHQFYSVIQCNAITLSVLLKGNCFYKSQFGACSNFQV